MEACKPTCAGTHRHAWEGAEPGAKDSVLPNKKSWVQGDPGSLGLLCFGMTTCMLMFTTTKWSESTFLPTVFCYAMFYGGLGQFVAGVLELIRGSNFSGTAFASYGAFWMGWFLLEYLTASHPGLYPPARIGKTLWCGLWAVLTAGFFVVTLRKNGCLMTIFSTLVITFSLLAGGVWDKSCEKAAGYFGFFCGSSAIYAAFAFLYDTELGIKLPGVRPVNFLPGVEHPNAVVQPAPPAAGGGGGGGDGGCGGGGGGGGGGSAGGGGGSSVVVTVGAVDPAAEGKVGQRRARLEPRAGDGGVSSGRSGSAGSSNTARNGGGGGTSVWASIPAPASHNPTKSALPDVV